MWRTIGSVRFAPSTRAWPGDPSLSVTWCARPPMSSVVSSVHASSSSRFGSRSATPWEASVRLKSTGSPPAPTSSISCTSCRMSGRAGGSARADGANGSRYQRDRPVGGLTQDRNSADGGRVVNAARETDPRERSTVRKRLSFANVTSMLALFIALGGTGYAAATLPANSVGKVDVAGLSRAAQAVNGVTFRAAAAADGTSPKGNAKTITRNALGVYSVDLGQDVSACQFLAGVAGTGATAGFATAVPGAATNLLTVNTFD